jgi:hypothetical protein
MGQSLGTGVSAGLAARLADEGASAETFLLSRRAELKWGLTIVRKLAQAFILERSSSSLPSPLSALYSKLTSWVSRPFFLCPASNMGSPALPRSQATSFPSFLPCALSLGCSTRSSNCFERSSTRKASLRYVFAGFLFPFNRPVSACSTHRHLSRAEDHLAHPDPSCSKRSCSFFFFPFPPFPPPLSSR